MPSSLPCDAPPCQAVPDDRLQLIVDSYRRLTRKELIDLPPLPLAGEGPGERVDVLRHVLWNAPRAIVAHGTEDDPVFFYGNRLALELFEMSFEDFTRLPSRYSAEPLERDARALLLERVARQGYVDDYAGVRISGKGRRFMIEAATVWNLIDETGNHRGQAAAFADYRML
jgi:hypothetical protein